VRERELGQIGVQRFREEGVSVGAPGRPPKRMPPSETIRSEAQANSREAISLYLKSLRKHGEPIPPGIEEEVIEVAG
jgi:hypothetical protein